jgi:hypothetical protein
MAELIALYIICKNIGTIARSRGVKARPFQMKAVMLWLVFEFVGASLAGAMGMQGLFAYLAGFGGALLSLHFSFKAVQAAVPQTAVSGLPQQDTIQDRH